MHKAQCKVEIEQVNHIQHDFLTSVYLPLRFKAYAHDARGASSVSSMQAQIPCRARQRTYMHTCTRW